MSTEWYFQIMGETFGPLSAAQMREKAHCGDIAPDTWVRKGADGRWVAADTIRGLIKDNYADLPPKVPPLPRACTPDRPARDQGAPLDGEDLRHLLDVSAIPPSQSPSIATGSAPDAEEYVLSSLHEPAGPNPPTCPSCHAVLSEQAVLCVNCGYHITTGKKLSREDFGGSASPPKRPRNRVVGDRPNSAARDVADKENRRERLIAFLQAGALLAFVAGFVATIVYRDAAIWCFRAIRSGKHAAQAAACFDRIEPGMSKSKVESVLLGIPSLDPIVISPPYEADVATLGTASVIGDGVVSELIADTEMVRGEKMTTHRWTITSASGTSTGTVRWPDEGVESNETWEVSFKLRGETETRVCRMELSFRTREFKGEARLLEKSKDGF